MRVQESLTGLLPIEPFSVIYVVSLNHPHKIPQIPEKVNRPYDNFETVLVLCATLGGLMIVLFSYKKERVVVITGRPIRLHKKSKNSIRNQKNKINHIKLKKKVKK